MMMFSVGLEANRAVAMQGKQPKVTSGYEAPEVRVGEDGRGASSGSSLEEGRLSPAKFASHFQACSRELWCVAAGVLGRRDSADDVLQEAAVIGLGKLDSFDPGTSFAAWMAQIVRYVALNHRRKHQRSRTSAADQGLLEAQPAANSREPLGLTHRGEVNRAHEAFDDAMLQALENLEPVARECLLLRVVMDMPYKDVARIVGVPEGTAMSHVHRSRHTLRAALTKPHQGGSPGRE